MVFLILLLMGFDQKVEINEVCLSKEEKKLYDLIMEYRKSKKLESIPLSSKLTLVAQAHAKDLSEHYEFNPKNKCNPHSWSHSWSNKGNWTSCCYTNDHKQVSCMWTKPQEIAGYVGDGFEIAYYSSLGASAQEGLDGWKISPGHNPLLVNTGTWSNVTWNAIGIGIYKEYGLVWFGEVKDDEIPQVCKR
jgi:hypothetical protein